MKIGVSGTSGFVGGRVRSFFLNKGDEIITLTRHDLLKDYNSLLEKINTADIIIHLSGASLLRRWSKKNKAVIRSSRINTTRNLTTAIREAERPPSLFISTSAVGIYQSNGVHSEDDFVYDMGFPGQICKNWEAEAMQAVKKCRVAIFRFGIILDKKEGAFAKMVKIYKTGFGGTIASGKQPVAWVHIEDVLRAYEFTMHNPRIHGAVNIVSPGVIQSAEYTRMLARKLHKPHLFPLPGWALRLRYGKGAILLTEGQSVVPKRLLDCGFTFKYPLLKDALDELVP
ncbi:MAG: TIGR01777 family protein [Bacteroidia bacterium]|nr:TIGR01777 family protein [Bacteroidia bacterium]